MDMTPFSFLSFLGIGYVHHKFVSTYRFGHKYVFMANKVHMFATSNIREIQWHNLGMGIYVILYGYMADRIQIKYRIMRTWHKRFETH
jgi:hypothetical protein